MTKFFDVDESVLEEFKKLHINRASKDEHKQAASAFKRSLCGTEGYDARKFVGDTNFLWPNEDDLQTLLVNYSLEDLLLQEIRWKLGRCGNNVRSM